jgi:hypothetical protein
MHSRSASAIVITAAMLFIGPSLAEAGIGPAASGSIVNTLPPCSSCTGSDLTFSPAIPAVGGSFTVTFDFSAALSCPTISPPFVTVQGKTILVQPAGLCDASSAISTYHLVGSVPGLQAGAYDVIGLVSLVSVFDPPPQQQVAARQLVVGTSTIPSLSVPALLATIAALAAVGAYTMRPRGNKSAA